MKTAGLLKKYATAGLVALALSGLGAAAQAEDTLNLAGIFELTGPGTTAGTNFKNGVDLAVKEINAGGGVLGRQIKLTVSDTQTNPGVAKGLTQKAVDDEAFAIFGPVYSGSIMVSMATSQEAKIPNFVGGEAASITEQGNPYVYRTSLNQADAMPKIARYMIGRPDVNKLAVIFVNNDFGKGGRDAITAILQDSRLEIVADISTAAAQVDFSSAVLKAKQSGADAIFAYLNEEESARLLRELQKQGWDKPVIGETTLVGQKVIELAGSAAEGAIAHVGLTVDAPVDRLKKFGVDYKLAFGYGSDHNGIKGYSSVYILKDAIEKVGSFDREAVNQKLHGIHVSALEQPGVLMDVSLDDKGDLDRESFLVKVVDGKQEVVEILPPLSAK